MRTFRASSWLSGVIYAFLLAPILVVIVASFNAGAFLTFPPQGLSLRWYATFLHNEVFVQAFLTSIRIAAVATLSSGIIGTLAALYTARARPSVANRVRMAMMIPMLLPEVLTAIGLLFFFYALGIGLHYGVALLAGHILLTLPFIYLSVLTSLQGYDWSCDLAARSLGAGPFKTFFRITFPLIRPGVIGGCLFAFIASFDAFSTSFLLKDIGTATLPLQLFDYLRLNFTPEAAAVSSFTIFVTLLVIVVTERLAGAKLPK
ncbi:ABC transporter permease [Sphingomonas bacterium]|uniref:ABC transporter permease n=1 Tax=Sphingomonas bacterium TaxID=1895847 RepID=UPI001575D994|nr:ABC transporter permease [Sphingomonas bacterium]